MSERARNLLAAAVIACVYTAAACGGDDGQEAKPDTVRCPIDQVVFIDTNSGQPYPLCNN